MAFKFKMTGKIDTECHDDADIILNVLMNHRQIVDVEWESEEVK